MYSRGLYEFFRKKKKQVIDESIERFMEKRRPPPEGRDDLDLEAPIEEQSVFVPEVRPDWEDPDEVIRTPVMKATYIESRDCWKLYWMPSTLEWETYRPAEEVDTIDEVFRIVDEDETLAFFG